MRRLPTASKTTPWYDGFGWVGPGNLSFWVQSNLPEIDGGAAHDRPAWPPMKLRRRVDDDTGPVLRWAQQVGRREGAVDDQRDAVGVGDGGNGFEVK